MKKLKICVYAISKNEEKHVNRWYNSVKEADEIYVLDTGSTDKTVAKLKKLGVHVKKNEIIPWRFDVARNESLNMVPKDADICVCIDLDEVFLPGWREKIEKLWKRDTTKICYIINSTVDENGKPKIFFRIDKIHSRNGYKWESPIHEFLIYNGTKKESPVITDEIIVNHYPDKSKSRSNYLPLLKLAVKENIYPERNTLYLGREYMYHQKWNKCIDTCIKYLSIKNAIWKEERSAAMRFIATSYIELKRYAEARMWLDKAINEAPHLRDPYIQKALLELQLKNWPEVEKLCLQALKIKNTDKAYINEIYSWDHTPYDLLSLSYFYQEMYEESLFYIQLALKNSPNDKRLMENCKIIKKQINKD